MSTKPNDSSNDRPLVLHADPERADLQESGIYIRAIRGDRWDSVDLAHLTLESARAWLESGNSRYVEVTLYLLGHDTTGGC